jgi:hypothetical protein
MYEKFSNVASAVTSFFNDKRIIGSNSCTSRKFRLPLIVLIVAVAVGAVGVNKL